jgi:hypothetical protein
MKKIIINRRNFLLKSIGMGSLLSIDSLGAFNSSNHEKDIAKNSILFLKSGDKQLIVDDLMFSKLLNIKRKIHPGKKYPKPVLEADMPWEQGELYDRIPDKRVYIYGTVLYDENTNLYRMWYNRKNNNYYATSIDGFRWDRPILNQLGDNNMIDLFGFHSPSIIEDIWDSDPLKRYKAVGSTSKGYCAAYSADGIIWILYPLNPILSSSDTITLAQDTKTGEYFAFHKRNQDNRVKGRQVFLSISKDMQLWSYPEPVMVTDDLDHVEAQKLEGGTHSEFYNMSAFPYGNIWIGFVTHFRRTGEPKIKKYEGGFNQSYADGPIDVQLVYSRDGRKWERCSDRSPVIPLGPYKYDSGSILGLCNSPLFIDNEMWLYYTAITTTHGGYIPDKSMSIARTSWPVDRFVSFKASDGLGVIETKPFISEGKNLFINADCKNGSLSIEVLDLNNEIIDGYSADDCLNKTFDEVKQSILWKNKRFLPINIPIYLRFILKNGDLFSYEIK